MTSRSVTGWLAAAARPSTGDLTTSTGGQHHDGGISHHGNPGSAEFHYSGSLLDRAIPQECVGGGACLVRWRYYCCDVVVIATTILASEGCGVAWRRIRMVWLGGAVSYGGDFGPGEEQRVEA